MWCAHHRWGYSKREGAHERVITPRGREANRIELVRDAYLGRVAADGGAVPCEDASCGCAENRGIALDAIGDDDDELVVGHSARGLTS